MEVDEAQLEVPSKSSDMDSVAKEAKKKSKKEKKSKSKKEKKEKRKREEDEEGGSSSDDTKSQAVKATTAEEARAFYEKEEIVVTGNGIEKFKPYLRFEQANFPPELKVYYKDFKAPTPIQATCWPALLAGRDLVGIAETGSGKTMAFALPGLVYLRKQRHAGGSKKHVPRILVLAPTRELAMQTHEAFERGGTDLVRSVCIYGGVPKHEQRRAVQRADVVVATPGRLQDLLDEGACDLSQVSFLVLDEADRMLDVGFEQAVRKILQHCRPTAQRQTLMFSATWPDAVRRLADEFMRGADDAAGGVVRVAIGNTDLAASGNVTQIVQVLQDDRDKEFELQRLLKDYHRSRTNRILIFALYKKEAMRIEQNLSRRGWKVQAIHGDKSQDQRTAALADFKAGTCPLLVATDVAARGLDIPNVEYVINYTFPLTIEDYVHRIGRTGRGGRKGIAHTLFTATEKHLAGALQNVLRQANQEIPEALRKFGGTVKKKEHSSYGAFFRDVDTSVKATKIVFEDSD
ncbi:P-loop containing nucleoside triphosphate hydrolase protein [Syncephalis pseudoplumigaleata]|uniref:RNA helicase n=1 Tax=Syncephalis pseudoplumigaleata TaxID=1712513 RepID=A0A4V1J1I9_9FUNG|nr:P-loop containing nucleoside triphosphate hydrolase protein [Syncephalis pseudoplumigaleata]|eukprot:RKP25219.1 P-loop containing nucleoside triphosphate hydrolase protein [Syncephalis pseudoplumigaleata]